MEIKYLEWNLNARGNKNYTIPSFVPEYIIQKNVDIMVLLEFCCGDNWNDFKCILEKDYDLYISPYISGNYNQVCIALRRSRKFQMEKIIVEDACDINIPEFLQIDVHIDEKQINIIGTRIKTEGKSKENQYNFLKTHFKSLNTVLCLGDFNCVYNKLSEFMDAELDVYGPRIKNNYYSFVFENGDCQGLDWVITKGISSVYNPYDDKNKTPYATYDWEYITEDNGYEKKTKADYLNIEGLPDHAILTGAIDI
ncbi:MAG: hypothetical protein K2K56_02525 [Lachnospiraceae bacterium]|nr:hypothetical protein [Lachnospiraceae bacterium]